MTPNPSVIAKSRALPPTEQDAAASAAPEFRHRRGDIWMVAADDGNPPVGTEIWSNRPAVIISNNVINGRAGFAQIVYLSTSPSKRTSPTHVQLPDLEGKGQATALCEQVHTVDASRLRRKLGTVPAGRIRDIDAGVAFSLSIGRNPDTYNAFRKWEEHIKLYGLDLAAEINALSGQTTDQRVEALTRALTLMTIERDAWRNLYEASGELPAAMHDVVAAIDAERSQD